MDRMHDKWRGFVAHNHGLKPSGPADSGRCVSQCSQCDPKVAALRWVAVLKALASFEELYKSCMCFQTFSTQCANWVVQNLNFDYDWTVASLDVVTKNRSHLGYTLTLQLKPTSYCSDMLQCCRGLWIQETQAYCCSVLHWYFIFVAFHCWGWKCSPPVAAQPYRWEYKAVDYVSSQHYMRDPCWNSRHGTYSDSWLTTIYKSVIAGNTDTEICIYWKQCRVFIMTVRNQYQLPFCIQVASIVDISWLFIQLPADPIAGCDPSPHHSWQRYAERSPGSLYTMGLIFPLTWKRVNLSKIYSDLL